MEIEKPLVSRKYLLEKFPGKGGWTYTVIPEVLQDKKSPFGWVNSEVGLIILRLGIIN